jgi:hypothetical protein
MTIGTGPNRTRRLRGSTTNAWGRIWRVAGLAVALVVTTLLAAPGTSYASSTSRDQTWPFVPLASPVLPFVWGFNVTQDWKVGDCHVFAPTLVGVRGDNNSVTVLLHGVSATDHTNSADIWHSTFDFFDSEGRFLFRAASPAFDSPRMVPANGRSSGPSDVYTWDRQIVVPMVSPSLWLQIRAITWHASC